MKMSGSCHCGAVRFTVDAVFTELTTCDCSLCVKKCFSGALNMRKRTRAEQKVCPE